MLEYKFTARDPATGRKVASEVQAENESAAAKMIRDQGLAPLEINLKYGQKSQPLKFVGGGISTKERVIFARQLSTLINSGLPLIQSLNMVADQTTNKPLKIIITYIIRDIEAGLPLSQALSKHPQVFSPVFIGVVEAGETSGTLDKSLDRLATQQERDAEMIAKVKGAMAYPAIVLVVMLGVVGFMVVKVLPEVENLYKGVPGATLPFVTRGLLAVAHFIIDYWYILLIVFGVGGYMFYRWSKTDKGKWTFDKFRMRAPMVGNLFMKVYMARFARTGSTLVASGVPLLQMLEITGGSVDNKYIEKSIKEASEKVRGGKALSETLEGDPNFLPLVPSMLRIGEQSGSLDSMLERTADYYEKEVDNQLKTISTIIEPMLMVVMGVMALLIVVAILLPIYGLVGQGAFKN